MTNPIVIMIQDYFYLRQRIPLLLYLYYAKYKDVEDPGTDRILKIATFMIGAIVSFVFTSLVLGVPFSSIYPLKWNYAGVLTWGIFFLIYYDMAQHSHLNKLTAFTLSTLATVGGGWLYEIPFFHPIQMFVTYNSIFYLNGQIMCLILLAYELYKIGFKPNKTIYATTLLYLTFSGMLLINWRLMARALGPLYIWTYRLPTCILLLSLLSGLKKKGV